VARQDRLVAAAERKALAVAQYQLVVAVKHRLQFRDECHSDRVRTMHPDEFAGIKLRDYFRKRFANQMHFAAGMDFDVISRCRYALNAVHRDEISAGPITHQDLLDWRGLARHGGEHPADALFQRAGFGIGQFRPDAFDALHEALTIEGLEQVIKRLHIKGANRVLRVGGCEHNVRRACTADRFEDVKAAA
jgi:hypothetical protein